jgi:hypothetical protein
MTEEEWLGSTDPQSVLWFLEGKISDRKVRLFMTACIRIRQGDIPFSEDDPVVVMEGFVDGLVTADEVDVAWQAPWSDALAEAERVARWCQRRRAWPGGTDCTMSVIQTNILRCIFGPLLFRTMSLSPDWRTPTTRAIAKGIYDDRAFDRLPVLADALEDAGGDSTDILSHCRQPGPHVRGCWVVDLLLGKE